MHLHAFTLIELLVVIASAGCTTGLHDKPPAYSLQPQQIVSLAGYHDQDESSFVLQDDPVGSLGG